MKMKTSQYNIYVDAGDDKSFVYNSMTNAVLTIDRELKGFLEKNELTKIGLSFVDPLKKCGIIVEEDIDELKVYRLKHNLAKYNTKKASSFLVFPTYSCNLKCPYCYEGPVDAEYRHSFMSPETTVHVVEFIKNQTVLDRSSAICVGLYGGEPLLNVECCETILRHVSEWCQSGGMTFYAALTTNGTLLTESVYERIGKYVSSIHITLDGAQEFHDRRRMKKNGSSSYAEILTALELLKDSKEHLSVRINFDDENRHSLDQILDDLEERGLKGRPHFNVYFAQVIPQAACLTFPSDPRFRETNRRFTWYFPSLFRMTKEKGWGDHLALEPGEAMGLCL